MDQTVPAYATEVADYGRSRDPEPGEGALVKNVRPESPHGMWVSSRACVCLRSTASS